MTLVDLPKDLVRLFLSRVSAKTFYVFSLFNRDLASVCIDDTFCSQRRKSFWKYVETRNYYGILYTGYVTPNNFHDGLCCQWNEDGSISEEIPRRNGKIHGFWRKFYKPVYCRSQLMEIESYENGIPHGIHKYYWNNGQLEYSCIYEHGQKQGNETFYHLNGRISQKAFYVDGNKHGLDESFYDNGRIRGQCNWKYGVKDGIELNYNFNGTVHSRYVWKDGVAIEQYEEPCSFCK